jgi:hypothetical protein
MEVGTLILARRAISVISAPGQPFHSLKAMTVQGEDAVKKRRSSLW